MNLARKIPNRSARIPGVVLTTWKPCMLQEPVLLQIQLGIPSSPACSVGSVVNHRIAKVGKDPQDHPVQPSALHQWFSLNHVPQHNIQMLFKHYQARWWELCPGKDVRIKQSFSFVLIFNCLLPLFRDASTQNPAQVLPAGTVDHQPIYEGDGVWEAAEAEVSHLAGWSAVAQLPSYTNPFLSISVSGSLLWAESTADNGSLMPNHSYFSNAGL